MNFKESKPIYLQIADRICDEVLFGQYREEERIPSVREYAAVVEVNANTVMKKKYFMEEEIDYFFKQMYTLGISAEELSAMYREFSEKQK